MAIEIKKISGRTAEGVDANGNIVLYTKVLTNLSGLPMSDADVDNDTYLKIDYEYFKKNDSGTPNIFYDDATFVDNSFTDGIIDPTISNNTSLTNNAFDI